MLTDLTRHGAVLLLAMLGGTLPVHSPDWGVRIRLRLSSVRTGGLTLPVIQLSDSVLLSPTRCALLLFLSLLMK